MKLKTIILLIIVLTWVFDVKAQFNDTIRFSSKKLTHFDYRCLYGDTAFMYLHPNGRIFEFKKGELKDGNYIAFFNNNFTDTALTVLIANGKIEGLYRRWDDDDNLIFEECEYKNGQPNGWRKLYFHSKEYGTYINIMRCYDGACEEFYSEW